MMYRFLLLLSCSVFLLCYSSGRFGLIWVRVGGVSGIFLILEVVYRGLDVE